MYCWDREDQQEQLNQWGLGKQLYIKPLLRMVCYRATRNILAVEPTFAPVGPLFLNTKKFSDDQKCLSDVTLGIFLLIARHSVPRTSCETHIFMDANWYTDSLTGSLHFAAVSTLGNPKAFALPSHFTDRSLAPAVHLPDAAKGHSSWSTVFWPSRGKPLVCGAGSCRYGLIWPQSQAARLWALLQPWQSCYFLTKWLSMMLL